MIDTWYLKWQDFLAEKTLNPETMRWHFTHRRIRSAYRSIKTNIPYLFTYLEYPNLDIPNTTNSLEGAFSNLKIKLQNHRGLKNIEKSDLSMKSWQNSNHFLSIKPIFYIASSRSALLSGFVVAKMIWLFSELIRRIWCLREICLNWSMLIFIYSFHKMRIHLATM